MSKNAKPLSNYLFQAVVPKVIVQDLELSKLLESKYMNLRYNLKI